MSLSCPICHSSNLLPQRDEKQSRSIIGVTAAAVAGLSTTQTGRETGTTTNSPDRPVAAVFGTFAKAFMGALAGTTAGCRTRSTIGNMVVAKVLGTYRCADCNYTFSS
ncbi:putative membrane protein [Herbaspirillum frisingense]|uniref:Membrane protein n=1 Tax=Herbaspirillum frisingense TaxID=92645 RepID=A0ABU1PJM2_9BURK|nr:putative membrane protein [Herbaspirillum frisingense]